MLSAVTRQMRSIATQSLKTRSFSGHAASSAEKKPYSFKEAWLSDAGAYPVMFTISFAVLFSGGFALKNAFMNKDVRVNKTKRMSTLRTWG